MKTVFFTSLGCAKNLVDSEVMLGYLQLHKYESVDDPQKADIIIVNTCSFIDIAKEESVNVVLEMAEYKNPEKGICNLLVVAGCLSQRYPKDLETELPEVDIFLGTGQYQRVVELINLASKGELSSKTFVDTPEFLPTENDPRINSSPSYMAWLKIAEGCDRHCAFCVIPQLRGKMRSRTVDSLVKECKKLGNIGVKEVNIIAQDLSQYGSDLSADNNLVNLIEQIEKIDQINWIRLLYHYPDELSKEFVMAMAKSTKVCHYIDMPIQHLSDSVLKRMNRKITYQQIKEKVSILRELVPDIVIRTSVIVGFPGEAEDDFLLLKERLSELEFDHLGVFKFSDEEEAPSYKLSEKIDPDIAKKRFEEIYKLQKKITRKKNKKHVGKIFDVIIEGYHDETDMLIKARFFGQAPEVDGKVIINDDLGKTLLLGDIIKVKITKVLDYDLLAEVV